MIFNVLKVKAFLGLALVFCLLPPSLLAEDNPENPHYSSPDPRRDPLTTKDVLPKSDPKLQPETEVKISEDKTIRNKEYLVPCGQSCAYEAATEAMAAFGLYFQNYKQSTLEIREEQEQDTKAYNAMIDQCTRQQGACSEDDKRKLLNISLHYSMGKFIRNAYLENASNMEDIKSLGYDDKKLKNPNEVESLNYKWFRGEDTYRDVTPQVYMDIQESNARDNFRFDLKDFEKETFGDQVQTLDAEFYKDYSSFFQKYEAPEDRLFAKARTVGDPHSQRQLASSDDAQKEEGQKYVFDVNPDSGKLEVNDGVRKEVQEGHKGAYTALKEAREAALKEEMDPQTGTRKFNAPDIFKQDDRYFDDRLKDLNTIIQWANKDLSQSASLMKSDDRDKMIAAGIPPAAFKGSNKDIANAAQKLKDELMKKKNAQTKNKSQVNSYQIAADINKLVDNLVEQHKQDDPDGRFIYTMDVAAFDYFLEGLWPTNAGAKMREQYLRNHPQPQ